MGGDKALANDTNLVEATLDPIEEDDEELPEDEEEFMYLRKTLDGLFRREQTHMSGGEGDEPFVENA